MAHDLTGRTVYFHIPLRFRILYLNDTFFSFSHANTYKMTGVQQLVKILRKIEP